MPNLYTLSMYGAGLMFGVQSVQMFTKDPEKFGLAFWRALQWFIVLVVLHKFFGGKNV